MVFSKLLFQNVAPKKKAAQLASLMRAAVIAGKISHLTFAFEKFAFFVL